MPLPNDTPKDYRPEFKELGVGRVRSELLMRRWPADKLSAARIWVEAQDAQSWMAERKDVAPKERSTFVKKYAVYVAGAFGAAYAVARVFRTLKGY